MKSKLQHYIIHTGDTILEAMERMNKNGSGTVFVCDLNSMFYGTITDGDVRRFLVNGGNIQVNVMEIVNRTPFVIHNMIDRKVDYQKIMQDKLIKAIPVLDSNRMLVDIVSVMDHYKKIEPINVPVVIMAGGMGTRLQPYTNILPKPLIPIGNKTITERIMDCFIENGSNQFYMIVNYKKDFIKIYFQDKDTKYVVQFIDEKEYCGTGGGLVLLKGKITETFIMTNCDILIEDCYSQYFTWHKKNQNVISVVGAQKVMQLPYGVINADEQGNIINMEEKPQYTFLTNTGFYLMEPEVFDLIPADTYMDMTELIEKCIASGCKVGTYQIEDNKWFDMGQLDELERMRRRFE